MFGQKEKPFSGRGGKSAIFATATTAGGGKAAPSLLSGSEWATSLVALEGEEEAKVVEEASTVVSSAVELSLSNDELESL